MISESRFYEAAMRGSEAQRLAALGKEQEELTFLRNHLTAQLKGVNQRLRILGKMLTPQTPPKSSFKEFDASIKPIRGASIDNDAMFKPPSGQPKPPTEDPFESKERRLACDLRCSRGCPHSPPYAALGQ